MSVSLRTFLGATSIAYCLLNLNSIILRLSTVFVGITKTVFSIVDIITIISNNMSWRNVNFIVSD